MPISILSGTRPLTVLALLVSALSTACGGDESARSAAPDVLAAVVTTAAASSDSTSDSAVAATLAAAPAPAAEVYGVINLGPTAAQAHINDRDQAAFWYFDAAGNSAAFYDGWSLTPLGSLGGGNTEAAALNIHGEITGSSSIALPPGAPDWLDLRRAFRWSAGAGMRALPGPAPDFSPVSQALGINRRGQIAGYAEVEGLFGPVHAVRWGSADEFSDLAGGPGFRGAVANAINDAGRAVGFADDDAGIARATLWRPSGEAIDMGTLGYDSYATHVNVRDEAIGYAMLPSGNFDYGGFLWSPGIGITGISTPEGYRAIANVLNNRGEVGGFGETADGWPHAMVWSRALGMRNLHGGPYNASGVTDINDRGELVGWIGEPVGETGYVSRAVRFMPASAPIDLNTQLANAPASLVLTDALAISADGTILANSNAGLLMLRPGRREGNAPLLGPVVMPTVVAIGEPLAIAVEFTDRNRRERQRADVRWGDGASTAVDDVRVSEGAGTITAEHRYSTPGAYFVHVRMTDSGGRSTEVRGEIQVVDPAEPMVSGRGAIISLPQAARGPAKPGASGPLRFAFHAAAPGAKAKARVATPGFVRLDGALRFQSDALSLASASAGTAQLVGSGRLNGKPGYRIVVDVTDGQPGAAAKDMLRMRIMHTDRRSGTEVVDYDNGRSEGRETSGDKRAQSSRTTGASSTEGAVVVQGDIVIR